MPRRRCRCEWEVAARRGMRQVVRRGTDDAEPRIRAFACMSSARARAGARVLVPLHRRRRERARSAGPAPRRPAARRWTGCASASSPAPITSSAISPPIAIWRRSGPTWCCSSATTSTSTPAGRPARCATHSDGVEATDLRTYRNRHAQYKTDPDLQALHAAAPWLVTWDDHEVQNDYADDWSQNFDDPAAFLARRAAAYRAFWEHMPLPRSAMPQRAGRDDLRPLRFRRSRDVSGARRAAVPVARWPAIRRRAAAAGSWSTPTCPERLDPRRSYLGKAQEAGSTAQFRTPPARWNMLAQGQLMAEFAERLDSGEVSHWSDDWNGYPAARAAAAAADRAAPASPTRWCSAATSIRSGRTI